jgi:hypothetical protein
MPRKKLPDPEELLTHPVILRVTKKVFERLEKIQTESNCGSVGEVARKILSNDKIQLVYKDISLNGPMEEMALIRKELKAIGVNINQLTRSFNSDKQGKYHNYFIKKSLEQYQKVDEKVERLLALIAQLAEKWLQRS